MLEISTFLSENLGDIAAPMASRLVGRKITSGLNNTVKKIDNFVGKLGGQQPNNVPPQQQPSQQAPINQNQLPQQPR